jgi:drug/metabolite transporter (DMT)-like permease
MSINVIAVVLLAALLHATWNFLVKRSADTYQGMSSVVIGHAPFGFLALFFVPHIAPASLPYVAAGAIFHTGYQIFLLNSYRLGDLSQVYPLARGGAPFIVAAISVLFLGVTYGGFEIVALVAIGAGIVSLAFTGRPLQVEGRYAPVFLALVTGGFIAGYTLVDGLGARAAGTAVGYYSWVTLTNALIFSFVIMKVRPGMVRTLFTKHLTMTLAGGGASYLAYALVVWSFTQAPIALVASLRETSIIFASLLGVFILKERLSPLKICSIAVTLTGIICLRLGSYF